MTPRAALLLLSSLLPALPGLPAQTPARPKDGPLVQEVEAAGQAVVDAMNAQDHDLVATRREPRAATCGRASCTGARPAYSSWTS